jgi:tetratricopeptide (TPR) repeat protein
MAVKASGAAFERFRPMLALEPSASAPVAMRGIVPSWERFERADHHAPWFERVLPARFRPSFAGVPGLEAYASGFAAGVPARKRSAPWRRLVDACGRPKELTTGQKAGLAQLLGQLCLFPELERLLAAEPVPPGGELDEGEALLAYWKAFTPFMLYEPDWLDRTEVLLRVAESAKSGTRVRLIAALKFLVLNFENGGSHARMTDALGIAERAAMSLCHRVPSWESFIWQSKLWRTICYIPFHAGDHDRMEREFAWSLEFAERAIQEAAGAGATAKAYADENLHAVLATRAVACMHLKRPIEAEAWFQRMADLDPGGEWQRIGLGRARLASGRAELAAEDFRTALEISAFNQTDACDGLAQCMDLLERKEEARGWRDEAHRIRLLVNAAQARPKT